VVTLGGALLLFGAAMFGVRSLGVEFLPHLEEGNLFIRASLPASISLEAAAHGQRHPPPHRHLSRRPACLSAQGRPDDGTDPPASSTPNSSCR
jgi:cobalt-zinc-cadmium resistance protein CzcA